MASIADLQTPKGLDLQLSAASQDPAVSRYVTRDAIPAVQTIRFQAAVRGKADDYLLEDLDVEMSGKNDALGRRARVTSVSPISNPHWPIEEARLDVHLSAAMADLETWLPQDVRKTGTLRLQLTLKARPSRSIFNDLELELDDTQPLHGKIKGKLAYTVAQLEAMSTRNEPGAEVLIPADVDVSVDLATADLQSLSTLLDQALPDLGAAVRQSATAA